MVFLIFLDLSISEVLVAQPCPALCDSLDCGPPGSSVHGILPGKNGLPFPSLGDPPDPGVKPSSPALQADSLPSEAPGKPKKGLVNKKAALGFDL